MEYFYRGHDDNNKAVFDTIASGSYGECPYAEIANKLEKISRKNKAWSTRKSDTGKIPSQCNPHTTQPQIRFVKRWLRCELSLGW